MKLGQLVPALDQPARWTNGSGPGPLAEVSEVSYDPRRVAAGGLLVVVPEAGGDVRRLLGEARERRAVAAVGPPVQDERGLPLPYLVVADVHAALGALACAFFRHPARRLGTIGVTGTDGKTTTSTLVASLLEDAGRRTGLMTTAAFRIGRAEWENTTRQTTQEAVEIQEFLRRALDEGATHAVIETTSHGLELQRVYGCDFDVGVVTNITHDHLDFHGTVEAYRRAKTRLFDMLDPDRDKGLGIRPAAVLNHDDSSYDFLRRQCRVPVLDYGIDTPATVRAVDVELGAAGTRFRVVLPDWEGVVETSLIGRFNVSNCLAAIATAHSQGVPAEDIVRGLSAARPVAGRMERIEEGQPYRVVVDYAHTPEGLRKALATLRAFTPGRLIAVFGSAGEGDTQKRPIMGRIAGEMCEFFVITDEDPRDEDRERILRDIAAGAREAGRREGQDFVCIADRAAAIRAAVARARPGDTVLLTGKGHEQSIIVGGERLPWDDRRAAREAIREREEANGAEP